MTNPQPNNPGLRVHIEFDGYLNARDLGDVFVCLDEMYDKLLYSSAPYLRELPSADAARLRIRSVGPGSVAVEFMSGVTQIVESMDPMLKAMIAGLPTLAALARMAKDAADWALDFRGSLRDQNIGTAEQELDLAERRLDVLARTKEVIVELSPSQTATHVEASASLALQDAALIEVSNALTVDAEYLQQVILRSRITDISFELRSDGDPS